MTENTAQVIYFIDYERCSKQHKYSPKIFICPDNKCKNKGMICDYCKHE